MSKELDDLRNHFETTEREPDPARKLELLQDAIAFFKDFSADAGLTNESPVATNILHTYLRRIIAQVTETRRMDQATFNGYVRLLVITPDTHISDYIFSDPDARAAINDFGERFKGFYR